MELKTDIWVGALIRRAQVGGAFATVVRRGDRDAGDVLVKIAKLDRTARLFTSTINGEGETVWLDLSAGSLGYAEADVDAYVRRRADDDPDVWVVEVEDREGRTFLTEPVLGQRE